MKRASLFLLIALLDVAQAAPAPWYRWRSKVDGSLACAQTPLGEGWDRVAGPYRDARCEKPLPAR